MTAAPRTLQSVSRTAAEKAKARLSKHDPRLEIAKVRQFVKARISEAVLSQCGLPPDSRAAQSILAFEIDNEILHNFKTTAEAYVATLPKAIPLPDDSMGREQRILRWQRYYEGKFNDESESSREINKPVRAGGLTALHIAAQDGNLAEVKRLVEEESALTNIKDNNKMTPFMRARMMGHTEVAQYLLNFPQQ